ncbi:MoaD/ThiS family protein [Acidaminobacter sp.]|uniref:MoaD/ThiS family protein n=1 Tax=Acidaminobacter sp. TaxID=1872102 RepID=UPI00137DA972|nr:MoaD/ThiS family protein [Acidaminobacter sp.]MDK9710366.1 MoaD/ThiS family protein [Acidaminobacter sp.]MZQ97909.1 hypothetical protein [Acidaminobacter sp.]
MFIHVKFSGYIAASLGYREKTIETGPLTTVQDLLSMLDLPVSQSWIAVSIAGRLRDRRTLLKEGDEVLVLPLGGGG